MNETETVYPPKRTRAKAPATFLLSVNGGAKNARKVAKGYGIDVIDSYEHGGHAHLLVATSAAALDAWDDTFERGRRRAPNGTRPYGTLLIYYAGCRCDHEGWRDDSWNWRLWDSGEWRCESCGLSYASIHGGRRLERTIDPCACSVEAIGPVEEVERYAAKYGVSFHLNHECIALNGKPNTLLIGLVTGEADKLHDAITAWYAEPAVVKGRVVPGRLFWPGPEDDRSARR